MPWRLAGGLFFLYLLLASRERPWGDAEVYYDTTRALVDHGRLDIETSVPAYFYTVREGRKYGFGALGNVVALVPSYLAYKALRHVPGLPEGPLFALTSHLSSAALMALAGGLFHGLCRWRGASDRLATGMTLVLALATICFVYARSPYSEALQTMALLLVVERALAQARKTTDAGMAALGAASGVLVNAKLVYALVLPILAAYWIAAHVRGGRDGRRTLVRGSLLAAAAFLPFAALVLFHDWVKTGSLLQTGYAQGGPMFSGELFPALYAYALSTGQGLFFFSPPLLLGVLGLPTAWRQQRRETALLVATIIVLVLASAKYRIWHGGYNWGPRYLVPLTPLVLLLALPWLPAALARGRRRLRRAGVALLVAAGCLVQVVGAALYWDHYIRIAVAVEEQTGAVGWSADYLPHLYYVPQFSPIRGHWWLLRHLLADDPDLVRDAPWRSLVTVPIDLTAHWVRLRVDWWGLDWWHDRPRARLAGVMILAVLATGSATCGVAPLRRLALGPAPSRWQQRAS
jgi:hypothetical protein